MWFWGLVCSAHCWWAAFLAMNLNEINSVHFIEHFSRHKLCTKRSEWTPVNGSAREPKQLLGIAVFAARRGSSATHQALSSEKRRLRRFLVDGDEWFGLFEVWNLENSVSESIYRFIDLQGYIHQIRLIKLAFLFLSCSRLFKSIDFWLCNTSEETDWRVRGGELVSRDSRLNLIWWKSKLI